MTVAIGYIYDEGIVFCADTKVTTSIKTNESKLAFFCSSDNRCAMTFAMSSDDSTFPKSAVTACWEMVKKMDFSSVTMEAVHNTAQFSLAEFYRDHIYPHPDRTPGAVYLEILVGIWLRGETRLYLLHETLLEPIDDYECIGSGAYLSKYLIRQYRRANPGLATLADATLMTTFCVETAIDYDEHCGGEAEILIMRNNGQVDNAYRTATYPSHVLVDELQGEMWKLLRVLAHAQMKDTLKRDSTILLNEYFERVREVNAAHKPWYSGTLPKGFSE